MDMRRSILAAAALAAATLTACSGPSPATPAAPPLPNGVISSGPFDIVLDGQHVHVMRPRGYPLPNVARFMQPLFVGDLQYHSGNVQVTPSIYVTFWQFKTDPRGVAKNLTAFLRVVGGSPWLHTVTQYYQQPSLGTHQFITSPRGQLKSIWYDNTNAVAAHPSANDIAIEAIRSAQHFGFDPNATYAVVTPHGHPSAGFPKVFCGYHSATYSSPPVTYAYLPYMPDGGYYCGNNAIKDPQGVLEGVSIIGGHELAESQTDPLGQGWFDQNYSHEIGDECAWKNLRYTRIGDGWFTTQPLWSNAAAGCVQ
jgi:serine protease